MLLAAVLVAPIVADLMGPDAWRELDDHGNFNDPCPAIEILAALLMSGVIVVLGAVVEYLLRRRDARKA